MKPLVSVITPSFNQAHFLEFTLQSVLRQDYASLEYLVVDGGSQDGSQTIIQRYEDRLAWWISEPDAGQADAINKGLRKAQGEYIAWLNSDDLYLPGAVSAAVSVLEQNPDIGLVYGNALTADAEGRLLNRLEFSPFSLLDLLQFKIICQPAVFMRRSVLESVNYLDPSYHFFLDHQLWIRMARQAGLRHHPQTWAISRYHPDAKNVTLAAVCGEEAWRILEWAQSQPDLAELIADHRRQVRAGAYQISARYSLDAGKPGPAAGAYLKAAWSWPPSLKGYWHRLLFAGLSLIGLASLDRVFYRWKSRRQDFSAYRGALRDWPGIRL